MLAKLAVRNVKRQVGNYLIYFITVSLTVALMFAVNNVIYEKGMLEKLSDAEEMRTMLTALSVIVSLIVAFVLGYATSFMLKLRKREFGTYLTLGMTRRNILSVFFLETLILCAASLATGLLLGLAFYQGLMAVVTNIIGIEYKFAAYSPQGLFLTVVLVLVVFVLSSVTSALYLKRVSVVKLIHGAEKSEKRVRAPGLWLAVTVVSFAAIVGSCAVFAKILREMITDINAAPTPLPMIAVLVFAVAVMTFHMGLAKSLFFFLLRSEKFKHRGANTFTLRALSCKMSANSVMTGALAFLIAFAVICANLSFVLQSFNEQQVSRDCPYDIRAEIAVDGDSPITPDNADGVISKFAEIAEREDYGIYTSDKRELYDLTIWGGYDYYSSLKDLFIKESDYNMLLARLGKPTIGLGGGFMIAPDALYRADVERADFSGATLGLGGETLGFVGFAEPVPMSAAHFAAVVPDRFADGLRLNSVGLIYEIAGDGFDALALHDALCYYTERELADGSIVYMTRSDFVIRKYMRLERNSETAVFMIAALYAAFVFVFMAMAILALKSLSDATENRRRFDTLRRIGASARDCRSSLFRQAFAFFAMPFALPLLLSVPVGLMCADVMTLTGFAAAPTAVAAVAIASVIASVYALYFTATYLIEKRALGLR